MPRDLTPLETAITNVFADGSGDAVWTLAFLAAQTGFMASLPRGADPLTLVDHNARRAVFGELYEILMLTERGRQVLADALAPPETETQEIL